MTIENENIGSATLQQFLEANQACLDQLTAQVSVISDTLATLVANGGPSPHTGGQSRKAVAPLPQKKDKEGVKKYIAFQMNQTSDSMVTVEDPEVDRAYNTIVGWINQYCCDLKEDLTKRARKHNQPELVPKWRFLGDRKAELCNKIVAKCNIEVGIDLTLCEKNWLLDYLVQQCWRNKAKYLVVKEQPAGKLRSKKSLKSRISNIDVVNSATHFESEGNKKLRATVTPLGRDEEGRARSFSSATKKRKANGKKRHKADAQNDDDSQTKHHHPKKKAKKNKKSRH